MTTALVPLDVLGAEIKARIAAGDKAMDKAEQHYIAAGIQLLEAKARVKQTPGLTWPAFLNAHCDIRRRRADELIMIADGRTTIADLRMKKAESVRATRERKAEKPALRSAEPNMRVAAEPSYSPGVSEPQPPEFSYVKIPFEAAFWRLWAFIGDDVREKYMAQYGMPLASKPAA